MYVGFSIVVFVCKLFIVDDGWLMIFCSMMVVSCLVFFVMVDVGDSIVIRFVLVCSFVIVVSCVVLVEFVGLENMVNCFFRCLWVFVFVEGSRFCYNSGEFLNVSG